MCFFEGHCSAGAECYCTGCLATATDLMDPILCFFIPARRTKVVLLSSEMLIYQEMHDELLKKKGNERCGAKNARISTTDPSEVCRINLTLMISKVLTSCIVVFGDPRVCSSQCLRPSTQHLFGDARGRLLLH